MTQLPAELLRLIRHIQIETKKEVEEIFAGAYRSAFKGRGMEFEEVREYVPGDDIRSIDWNVTARLQTPHVKTFREERELTVLLVADISRSMQFEQKRESMARIGGALALAATENGDRVGLVLASDRVEKSLPPQKGFGHAYRLIRDLFITESEAAKTDLRPAIDFIGNAFRRPTICFFLSDFLFRPMNDPIRRLSKRHDVFGIHLSHSLETALPPVGLVRMKDQETGEERLCDWQDEHVRADYETARQKQIAEHRQAFLQTGGSFLEVPSGAPLQDALRPFFAKKARRTV